MIRRKRNEDKRKKEKFLLMMIRYVVYNSVAFCLVCNLFIWKGEKKDINTFYANWLRNERTDTSLITTNRISPIIGIY